MRHILQNPLTAWIIFSLMLLFSGPLLGQEKLLGSILITPQPAFFGYIPIGSSADREIIVYNTSSQTVNISAVNITGNNASNFNIVNNPGTPSLAPLEKLSIVVSYKPNTAGSSMAIMNVQSDAGTFSDSLQGQGIYDGNGPITFERIFGTSEDETGGSVWTTSDSGYIIAGSTTLPSAQYPDIYVVRTDKYGKVLWTNTYGGQYEDYGVGVVQASSGNFVVLASSNSYSSGQNAIYLLKIDRNGNKVWDNVISENKDIVPSSIRIAHDGGLIIAGNTKDTPDGSTDALLVKTDSQGNVQWKKHYGGSDGESASEALPTVDGGYILAGSVSYASSGDFDAYVVKTDSAGNLMWSKTYGGSNWDVANSIWLTTDGGYILAGYTVSYGAGAEDGYLVKIDNLGNQQWYKAFGYNHDDNFSSVIQTPDGGYLACGSTVTFFSQTLTYTDIYLVKTDGNGIEQWSKKFGGDKSENGEIRPTLDSGYIISGTTESYGQSVDFYLLKIRVNGSITGIVKRDQQVTPTGYSLLQNYPNPFNPSTRIIYSIKKAGLVSLNIYDVLGRKVATLENKVQSAGIYSINFNASNLSSGIYFYRIESGSYIEVKKMILIK